MQILKGRPWKLADIQAKERFEMRCLRVKVKTREHINFVKNSERGVVSCLRFRIAGEIDHLRRQFFFDHREHFWVKTRAGRIEYKYVFSIKKPRVPTPE